MGFEDCYLTGQVLKSHGVQGAVLVELFPSSTSFLKDMESVFVEIHQKPVPFFINRISFNSPDSAIIQFDDINSIEAARQLVNRHIYVLLTEIPAKIRNEFQSRDLIGFQMVDDKSGPLGPVTGISEHAGQVLLQVDHEGKEVLVPMHEDIIINVNRKKRELLVTLPEGLLQLYRGE